MSKIKKIFSKEALGYWIFGIVALLIGYFAGREHVKYELQSAFSEVGKNIKKEFQKSFSAKTDDSDKSNISNQLNKEEEEEKKKIIGFGEVYKTEKLEISVLSAAIDFIETKSSFSNSTSKSKEKHLFVKFKVKNIDERKVLRFRDSSFLGYFVLYDDVENHVRGVSFGASSEIVGAMQDYEEINPEKEATHIEVFSIPLDKTKFLLLKTDLKAFGNDKEEVHFKIPMKNVSGFPLIGDK